MKYREVSKGRINPEKLYRALAIAYRETGNAGEAEKFRRKIENL